MIANIKKNKQRDSNMELLRVLAMIGVMVVHADFFALGVPTSDDCISSPFLTMSRFVVESITIVCVNLFVLLSGCYGIHPRRKRLAEFLFQILFFNVLIFFSFILVRPDGMLTWEGIGSIFMFDSRFWFVKAYLLLYLLSPVLNVFIQQVSERRYSIIVFGFFLFQTMYGWLFQSVSWFNYGYSTISFVGLYLLVGYVRRQMGGAKIPVKSLFCLFALFVVVNSLMAFFAIRMGYTTYIEKLYAYNSPFVIMASVVVFLLFMRIEIKANWINVIAASSFAAFLLHCNYFFLDGVYVRLIKSWFLTETSIMFLIKTSIFISSLFLLAILIDRIRLWLWNILANKYIVV